MNKDLSRRTALKNIVAGTAALGVSAAIPAFAAASQQSTMLKGNVNHAVCRWCFSKMDLDSLCIEAKKIGIKAIDLVGPKDWPTLKKHGLYSSMCNGAEINLVDGWNDPQFHPTLIKNYSEMIPKVAEADYTQLICFSGSRRGKDDETGWKNCVDGLKQVLPLAEKHGVVLVMELLNSKVNHKDYQCDHTEWGVELCKRLGSENFKLLYDIYHMQIDEGNVISNIQTYHPYISHYHTAGVPGRNEIDDTQELYYPAIVKAIVATGFKGYLAQEFIPKYADKIKSLRDAVNICDV
ncbi:hydroxypyruvate isomerase family protein [Pedobacter heparinus]|uniref:Xylose isomerase domain protein TIM barrel n=1 Tax=Pedobacter heparinus (strain ATCC 13125 / DSM 2366 / CIP 104194 / JCM 7457 / NBRC 12017 / NCIMB 9290 / NRRL B-14731 / HIM 762-3) TaxID=485917 RepID=C6XU50_PEDHD|nr:TIM barrel protein [Pedobacter heparinus]ACU05843.1 Xylose isomerase domain protein TIM barrel [Pedobacter heparinus DSM 2366]